MKNQIINSTNSNILTIATRICWTRRHRPRSVAFIRHFCSSNFLGIKKKIAMLTIVITENCKNELTSLLVSDDINDISLPLVDILKNLVFRNTFSNQSIYTEIGANHTICVCSRIRTAKPNRRENNYFYKRNEFYKIVRKKKKEWVPKWNVAGGN